MGEPFCIFWFSFFGRGTFFYISFEKYCACIKFALLLIIYIAIAIVIVIIIILYKNMLIYNKDYRYFI